MYCINYRVGILFKENLEKKSYELRYFFIDDEANLFHIPSLARLQKIVRLSADFKQIKQKLIKFGQKSFSLTKYHLTQVIPYTSEAVIPFSNRTCFEIRLGQKKNQQAKEVKPYKIFGFLDEDTALLHHEIQVLTGRKKVEIVKRKSIIEDEKNKLDKKLSDFFQIYLQNEQTFKMSHLKEEGNKISFVSESAQGKPEGKCSQTLLQKDVSFTYTGQFYMGKKHGQGLLVSAQLDSLACQYLDDQIAGI